MEEKFQNLEEFAKGKLSDLRPDQEKAVDAIITLWRSLQAEGMQGFDFAHALLNMAESTMFTFEGIEEAKIFGEFTQESATQILRAINSHWPPVDLSETGIDWPKKEKP